MKRNHVFWICGLLAAVAAVAYAHTNTTIVSRLKLDWPDLGYEGGAGLHAEVTDDITRLGDNLDSRYQEYTGVADSAVTTFEHNFNVPFTELRVILYDDVGANKTRIDDPVAGGWTIAATAGFLKTKIDITAPSSGGPHDFSIDVTTASERFESPEVIEQADFLAQAEARFQDAAGGQYAAVKAPATIASSFTLTLPTDDGAANQSLTTDGSGVLGWQHAALDGGNTLGAALTVGTNDAFGLTFETSGTARGGISSAGVWDINVPDAGCTSGFDVCSGTATLTALATGGLDADPTSLSDFVYTRNGNVVSGFISMMVNLANSTASSFTLSGLPHVSSNFSSATKGHGSCIKDSGNNGTTNYSYLASSSSGAQTMTFDARHPSDDDNTLTVCTFAYQIP